MSRKYLVVGSTGGTGRAVINELLNQGKEVIAFVRNKSKAIDILKDDYDRLDSAVEVELGVGISETNQKVKDAIAWCDVLISTIGSTTKSNTKTSDYDSIIELINLCLELKDMKKFKFVFVTSMYITRPYSIISVILNTIVKDVLGWKTLAENRLRESGIDYLIIRPGQLIDSDENKYPVWVKQGDKGNGKISRKNLAKVILASLSSSEVNKQLVTIDVVENRNKETGFALQIPDDIIEDNKDSIIKADHFFATRLVQYTIISFVVIGLAYWILK